MLDVLHNCCSGTLAQLQQQLRGHAIGLANLPQVRYLPLAAGKRQWLATPGTLGLLPRWMMARALLAGQLKEAGGLGLPLSRPLVSVHCPGRPLTPLPPLCKTVSETDNNLWLFVITI